MSHFNSIVFDGAALSDAEQQRLQDFEAKKSQVRQQIVQWKEDRTLPILSCPEQETATQEIARLAETIRQHADTLIVLGTGGSSLGGKTLCELGDGQKQVQFIENLDPHSMQQCLTQTDFNRAHLLIISKSGGTMETLTQAFILLEAMESALGRDALSSRCHVVTMPGERALRHLAEQLNLPSLEHDPDIGGRYSVLSNVGLLPAAFAGVDIAAIQRGARDVMDDFARSDASAPLADGAWQAAMMPDRPTSVVMPYCDRLRTFGDWFRQLWAESLGKDGKGSTPAAALGAVDQHSQLQLYLDGPKDKCFTFITLPHQGLGAPIPQPPLEELAYLGGKTIGDAMAALQQGTIETLKRHHLPLRTIELPNLDETTLGALLMHFMLETMVTAAFMGVNAFDQPAVEESKQLAREALNRQHNSQAA